MSQYLCLYSEVTNKALWVGDCYEGNRWIWHKILYGFAPSMQHDIDLVLKLKKALFSIMLNDGKDVIRWRWTQFERYWVKSEYSFLENGGVKDRHFLQLWKIRTLLKVRIFVWTILNHNILTMDILLKRGWQGEMRCTFKNYKSIYI